MSIQGGDRFSIIDQTTSLIEKDVVYNETTPFTEQVDPSLIFDFTINYEWYKKKTAQKLSLKILNATNHEEFQGHSFKLKTNNVEKFREGLIIPNISYKISF